MAGSKQPQLYLHTLFSNILLILKHVHSIIGTARNHILGIRPIQTQHLALVPRQVEQRRFRAPRVPQLDALVVTARHEQILVVLRPFYRRHP